MPERPLIPVDPASQYADSANLTRRADLHVAYGSISWFAWLAARTVFAPGAAILDVGCGPGWFWRVHRGDWPRDMALTLVDNSPGMVAEAEAALTGAAHLAAVSSAVADAVALPCPDDSFDAVLLMHVLYHVSDPALALAEAYRVLRPGGMVYVTTNAPDDLQAITDIIVSVHGTEPMDFAASRVSLDRAFALVAARFEAADTQVMTDVYACTDPDLVLRFIRSMPPAQNDMENDMDRADALTGAVRAAFAAGGGVLRADKRVGVVSGRKPSRTRAGAAA